MTIQAICHTDLNVFFVAISIPHPLTEEKARVVWCIENVNPAVLFKFTIFTSVLFRSIRPKTLFTIKNKCIIFSKNSLFIKQNYKSIYFNKKHLNLFSYYT